MMVRSTFRDLNLSYGRLARTQERLSSGRQIVRASDDPAVAADAMNLRGLTRRSEQYARSLDDAQGLLGSADAALTSSLERLERAKEIAVRAGNSGGLSDPAARTAMAIEIRAIREDLIALANTRHGDRAVFAGNAAGLAYDATTGGYLGDAGAVRRDVAANTSVQVNVTGQDAFGDAGGPVGDIFQVLERMAVAVETADGSALATEHANLDAGTVRLGCRHCRDRQSRGPDERDRGPGRGRRAALAHVAGRGRGRRHRRGARHGQVAGERLPGGAAGRGEDHPDVAARLPPLIHHRSPPDLSASDGPWLHLGQTERLLSGGTVLTGGS